MIKYLNRRKLKSRDLSTQLAALEVCVKSPDLRAAKLIEAIVLSETASRDQNVMNMGAMALLGVLDHVPCSTIAYCVDQILGERHPAFGPMLETLSRAEYEKFRSRGRPDNIYLNRCQRIVRQMKELSISPEDPLATTLYIVCTELQPSPELTSRIDPAAMATAISTSISSYLAHRNSSLNSKGVDDAYRAELLNCMRWVRCSKLTGTARAIAALCEGHDNELATEAAKTFSDMGSPDAQALMVPLLKSWRMPIAMMALSGSQDEGVMRALQSWLKDHQNLKPIGPDGFRDRFEGENECLSALAKCGTGATSYLLDLLTFTPRERSVVETAQFHLRVAQELTALGWSPDASPNTALRFALRGEWEELRKDASEYAIALLVANKRSAELVVLGDIAVPILSIAAGGFIKEHCFAMECLVRINSEASVKALCSKLSRYADERTLDYILQTQNSYAIPSLLQHLSVLGAHFLTGTDRDTLRLFISKLAQFVTGCGASLSGTVLSELVNLPDIVRHEKEQTGYDPEGPGTAWYSESDSTYSCAQIRQAAKRLIDSRATG